MQSNTQTTTTIQATTVTESRRLAMLPKYFGRRFMSAAENGIFDTMGEICERYHGGYWEFFELSNAGFYMALTQTDEKVRIFVDGNGYEGEMTKGAAGIVACLMTFSKLSFQFEGMTDAFAEQFHKLRAFALDHPESAAIFGAID